MTLRSRFILYLIVVHLLMAGIAVFLFNENPLYLMIAEVVFAVSLAVGYKLVDSLFLPLRLIGMGGELISERDFTSRFRPVGQPEMDDLIDVYNTMIDRLREERLRAEEQRSLLERVVRVSPSGIVVCDYDGLIQQANPAAERLLQASESSLVGGRLAERGDPILAALATLDKGESRVITARGLTRLRCHRGEFVDQGFPRSFYLLEEITAELRATERAAYEKLIRMISHEVRNSVGAVGSLLESSLHYLPQISEGDRGEFGDAINVARERLTNLDGFVNGFADVVRLPEPLRKPTDVCQLIRDIGTLIRPELEERSIDLVIDVPDDAVEATIDKNQFEQLLLNLTRNAWEAIEKRGEIKLSVVPDKRRVQLICSDSGPGIEMGKLDEIFTPFFTTKRDGRGIGLTLVREIATLHGAELSFRNKPEGGAEFAVVV